MAEDHFEYEANKYAGEKGDSWAGCSNSAGWVEGDRLRRKREAKQMADLNAALDSIFPTKKPSPPSTPSWGSASTSSQEPSGAYLVVTLMAVAILGYGHIQAKAKENLPVVQKELLDRTNGMMAHFKYNTLLTLDRCTLFSRSTREKIYEDTPLIVAGKGSKEGTLRVIVPSMVRPWNFRWGDTEVCSADLPPSLIGIDNSLPGAEFTQQDILYFLSENKRTKQTAEGKDKPSPQPR